jgi:hypothetical protein
MEQVTWPADRFYWAILDTSRLPRAASQSNRRAQLEFALERYLPIPLEQVQAAFHRLDRDHTVACAAERDAITSRVEPTACSLKPACAPAFVAGADVSRLELLTGDLEPASVVSAKARTRIELAVIIVLLASIVSAGLTRRAQWHLERRSSAESIQRQLLGVVLPGVDPSRQSALQLTGELRRLEQTRSGGPTEVPSAVPQLAMMLDRWPSGPAAQVESIIVTETSLTVIATLDSMTDVSRLAAAIEGAPGWSMSQPEVRSHQDRVRATIRLQRNQEAG